MSKYCKNVTLVVALAATMAPRAEVRGLLFKRDIIDKIVKVRKDRNAARKATKAQQFIDKGKALLGDEKFEAAAAAFDDARRLCKKLNAEGQHQHRQALLLKEFYRIGEDEETNIRFTKGISRAYESLAAAAISEFSKFKGNFDVIRSASDTVIELLGDGKKESPLESTMREILAEEEPTAEEKAARMTSEGMKDVRWWSIRAHLHRAAVFIGLKEYQRALNDIKTATEAVSARFRIRPRNAGVDAEYWETRASFERDVSSMYEWLSEQKRWASFLAQPRVLSQKAEQHKKTAEFYEGLQLNGSRDSGRLSRGRLPSLPPSPRSRTKADFEDTE